MILAKLLAIAVMMLPLIIMATLCKSITTSLLTTLGAGHLSTFEAALAAFVPYLILVYLAIYRPIVSFFQTLQGKESPPTTGGE